MIDPLSSLIEPKSEGVVIDVQTVNVVNEYRSCTVDYITQRLYSDRYNEFTSVVSPVDPLKGLVSEADAKQFAMKLQANLDGKDRIDALTEFYKFYKNKDVYIPSILEVGYYGDPLVITNVSELEAEGNTSGNVAYSSVDDTKEVGASMKVVCYIKKTNSVACHKMLIKLSKMTGSKSIIMLDSIDMSIGDHWEYVITKNHISNDVANKIVDALSYACLVDMGKGRMYPCYSERSDVNERRLHVFDSVQSLIQYVRLRASAKVLSISSQIKSGRILIQASRRSFIPANLSATLEAYSAFCDLYSNVGDMVISSENISTLIPILTDQSTDILESMPDRITTMDNKFVKNLLSNAHIFSGSAISGTDLPPIDHGFISQLSNHGKLPNCGLGLITSICSLAWLARTIDVVEAMSRNVPGAYDNFLDKKELLTHCSKFTKPNELNNYVRTITTYSVLNSMTGILARETSTVAKDPIHAVRDHGSVTSFKIVGGGSMLFHKQGKQFSLIYEKSSDMLYEGAYPYSASDEHIRRTVAEQRTKYMQSLFTGDSIILKLSQDIKIIEGLR